MKEKFDFNYYNYFKNRRSILQLDDEIIYVGYISDIKYIKSNKEYIRFTFKVIVKNEIVTFNKKFFLNKELPFNNTERFKKCLYNVIDRKTIDEYILFNDIEGLYNQIKHLKNKEVYVHRLKHNSTPYIIFNVKK